MFDSGSYFDFEYDSNELCGYFRELKDHDLSAQSLVEEFRLLFIEGVHYPVFGILDIVHRLTLSPLATERFNYVLNQCCYILINHWWSQSEPSQATNDLINLFTESPREPATSPAARRLRDLVKQFTQTQHYEALKRYAYVAGNAQEADENTQANQSSKTEKLRSFVHRYPCLYDYYILDSNSSELGRRASKQLQIQRERKFERDLLQYAPTLFANSGRKSAENDAENPTLLNDEKLKKAITQFAGTSERQLTYRDSASYFLKSVKQSPSYLGFKQQMHDYLISSIKFSNRDYSNKSHFSDWLSEQLRDIFPQSNDLKLTPSLLIKTCTQLIDALVATPDPNRPLKYAVFVDLHGNLGASFTIGLLLQIVLLCRSLGYQAKHLLESMKSRVSRQFAVMFKHYENQSKDEAKWLIECLDNLMIAFTIHFGQEDFSKWASLVTPT